MNNAPERIWIPKHDLPITIETTHSFVSRQGNVFNHAVEYIREDVIGYGFVAQATAFILGIIVGMVIVWQLF